MPMPGVFSAINSHLQGSLIGKNLQTLAKNLPDGMVLNQEGWVESKIIVGTQVYIKGKYDLLIKDSKNNHILVDLKISLPHADKIDKYKTQLNAYKFALENPKFGKPVQITRLGLLVFYPNEVKFENGTAYVAFPPEWLEVPLDQPGFVAFAREVDSLLTGVVPPEGNTCKWCQYRHLGETLTHGLGEESIQEEIPF